MRKSLVILGILNDSDLEWFIANGNVYRCQKGDVIIQEGAEREIGNNMYFLIDGSFEVWIATPERTPITTLYSGEIVGEISLLDSRPPSATVEAMENGIVLAINYKTLQAKMEIDINFQARLYRSLGVFLAQRLRNTTTLAGGGDDELLREKEESLDEIELDVLEELNLAGKRFEQMEERLRNSKSKVLPPIESER